jgi:hypothetical protein
VLATLGFTEETLTEENREGLSQKVTKLTKGQTSNNVHGTLNIKVCRMHHIVSVGDDVRRLTYFGGRKLESPDVVSYERSSLTEGFDVPCSMFALSPSLPLFPSVKQLLSDFCKIPAGCLASIV